MSPEAVARSLHAPAPALAYVPPERDQRSADVQVNTGRGVWTVPYLGRAFPIVDALPPVCTKHPRYPKVT